VTAPRRVRPAGSRGAGLAVLVACGAAFAGPSALDGWAADPAPPTVAAPSTTRPATTALCPHRLVGRIGRLLEGDGVDVAWRPVPGPIRVGEPFAIEFEVCARRPGEVVDRLRVDAWMPGHRHGMNYRPTLAGDPPGVLLAQGLVFHMPGHWQVVFELRAGERPIRLTDDLSVR
jgi:hypothetical protein